MDREQLGAAVRAALASRDDRRQHRLFHAAVYAEADATFAAEVLAAAGMESEQLEAALRAALHRRDSEKLKLLNRPAEYAAADDTFEAEVLALVAPAGARGRAAAGKG